MDQAFLGAAQLVIAQLTTGITDEIRFHVLTAGVIERNRDYQVVARRVSRTRRSLRETLERQFHPGICRSPPARHAARAV